MIRFDDFVVGADLGEHNLSVDHELLRAWGALFPDDNEGGVIPPGIAAVVTMRAYADVIAPRPPGNVHGSQRFTFARLPAPGQSLRTSLRCAGKEMKRERRWVQFESTTTDESGDLCFTALMTIAWAA